MNIIKYLHLCTTGLPFNSRSGYICHGTFSFRCHFRQCPLEIGSASAERVGKLGEVGGAPKGAKRMAVSGLISWRIIQTLMVKGLTTTSSSTWFQADTKLCFVLKRPTVQPAKRKFPDPKILMLQSSSGQKWWLKHSVELLAKVFTIISNWWLLSWLLHKWFSVCSSASTYAVLLTLSFGIREDITAAICMSALLQCTWLHVYHLAAFRHLIHSILWLVAIVHEPA